MRTCAARNRDPNKACKGKVRHATLAIAQAEALRMAATVNWHMKAYHCPFCDGYHVGRARRGKGKGYLTGLPPCPICHRADGAACAREQRHVPIDVRGETR